MTNRTPAEQAAIDQALAAEKKAQREIDATWHANRVTKAYNDLMAYGDKAMQEESPEERAFLALASIIRWSERHRLTPIERLYAIKTVAEVALRG